MSENPLAAYLPQPNQREALSPGAQQAVSSQRKSGRGGAISARRSANPLAAFLPEPSDGMPVGEMLSQAGSNIIPSGRRAVEDVVSVVADPIGTAKNLGSVIYGGAQLATDAMGLPLPKTFGDHRASADAVGQYFSDRYGGIEEAKRSFAEDPVGVVLDASTVLTGGGAAAARLPGVAGRVAKVARTAGQAIDPIAVTGRVAGATGRGAGKAAAAVLGQTTGAGSTAVRTAASAGMAGGDLGKKFRAAMRGQMPMEEVVADVRGALNNLYKRRSDAYREGMTGVTGDPTVLDFGKVDKALSDITEVKTFKGRSISKSTNDIRQRIAADIDEWRALDPAEYHTVEGFDALKQSVGDILDSTQYGTPEWRVANEAYQAVKQTITDQAPGYAKVMGDYTQATELLKEMQGELSLGKGKSAATALRKLQAIIRNDVSSAYGRRAELGGMLEDAGATGLTEKLAGQSMSSPIPRGFGNISGAAGVGGMGYGAVNPAMIIPAAGLVAASSPRLVGEVAHASGRAVSPGVKAARSIARHIPQEAGLAAFQMGRASSVANDREVARAGADYLMGLASAP